MPTIEAMKARVAESDEAARMYCQRTLKAEERAERAEHMAALWKRLAKRNDYLVRFATERNQELRDKRDGWRRSFDAAEAALAALKKDARICADYVELVENQPVYCKCEQCETAWSAKQAARRIIEATKECEE